MIDPKKSYRTRDGREVRIYAVDGKGPSSVVHGAVNAGDGWVPLSWHADGRYNTQTGMADLIEVPPCGCIELIDGQFTYQCECSNRGDGELAAAWCVEANYKASADYDKCTIEFLRKEAAEAAARIEQLEAALRLLHDNVVHAWPSLADLGPVAIARAALEEKR